MNNEAKGQHVISLWPQAIWFMYIWIWGLDNYGRVQKNLAVYIATQKMVGPNSD